MDLIGAARPRTEVVVVRPFPYQERSIRISVLSRDGVRRLCEAIREVYHASTLNRTFWSPVLRKTAASQIAASVAYRNKSQVTALWVVSDHTRCSGLQLEEWPLLKGLVDGLEELGVLVQAGKAAKRHRLDLAALEAWEAAQLLVMAEDL